MEYPSCEDACRGLPSIAGLANSVGASGTALMTNLQYAPFGPLKSWNWQTDAGPLAQSRTYDLSGRPVRYTLGSYLRDLSYDAAGRITSYTHYQRTTTPGQVIAQTSQDQSFGYDNLGRLTQAAGNPNSWSYTHDANGNRTSAAVNGGAPAAHTIDTASNRLMGIASPPTSLSYDAAGNELCLRQRRAAGAQDQRVHERRDAVRVRPTRPPARGVRPSRATDPGIRLAR